MTEFKRRYDPMPGKPYTGMPAWMSELLWGRGIHTQEEADAFLHSSPEDLHDPMKLLCMDRAVRLLRKAIDAKEPILVYGDYDVDGVSAVSVLLETLREEGAVADFRIPDRHSEGYGLNLQAVEEMAKAFRLLITVDCGISNVAEVRRARELGMTVIVTDHHEIPDELPPAHAIINPLLKPEAVRELLELPEGTALPAPYPYPRLCGAGVALKLCEALQGRAGVEKRLEIAALATVADVVPLTGENRVIVREGMLRMAQTGRPGLRALLEVSQVQPPIRSEDVAFRLAPRINAAGRLEHASAGVRLLLTRDEAEGRQLAEELNTCNQRRQEMEHGMLTEAEELFRTQVDLRRDRVIILAADGWDSGLIGLVAGKLCERYHHPTVVLSCQGDKAVGSCRSVPGIHIWHMLRACQDLLMRFGGHELAAGLTLARENIDPFRRRLNRAVREQCDDACLIPVAEYDVEMPLKAVTLETVSDLEVLEPTGCGNPAPVFLVRDARVQEARRVGRDGSHLKLRLLEGGELRDGIGFGLGERADWGMQRADVLFSPARNVFNGRVSAQLQVQAIRPAREDRREAHRGSASTEEEKTRVFQALLQEMRFLASKKSEYGGGSPGLRPEHLLKERLDGVDVSDEALRGVYRALRGLDRRRFPDLSVLAGEAGCSPDQLLIALNAFEDTGLLTWQAAPAEVLLTEHPARCAMTDSPLIRYLRSLPERKEEDAGKNEGKGEER